MQLDFYTCYTLFDITRTDAVHNKDHSMNEQEWEMKRNQQRHWDTMLQVISMRSLPVMLGEATSDMMSHHDFGTQHEGDQRVWQLRFGVESKDVFRKGADPVALLFEDSSMVPLSTGLTETANLDPACIIASGDAKNTYFVMDSPR
jgi:hypothetical protein